LPTGLSVGALLDERRRDFPIVEPSSSLLLLLLLLLLLFSKEFARKYCC